MYGANDVETKIKICSQISSTVDTVVIYSRV